MKRLQCVVFRTMSFFVVTALLLSTNALARDRAHCKATCLGENAYHRPTEVHERSYSQNAAISLLNGRCDSFAYPHWLTDIACASIDEQIYDKWQCYGICKGDNAFHRDTEIGMEGRTRSGTIERLQFSCVGGGYSPYRQWVEAIECWEL